MMDNDVEEFEIKHELDDEREQVFDNHTIENSEVLSFLYSSYRRLILQNKVFEVCIQIK